MNEAPASTTRPASSTPASPAPLEAHDPDRARALKAKIRDRVSDVRRHLAALRAAMAAERVEVASRSKSSPNSTSARSVACYR